MPESLIAVLVNAGVAGVVLILFVTGMLFPKGVVDDLRTERDALRAAVAAERQRGDAAVASAQATRDVFTALQAGASMSRKRRAGSQEFE